jgi:hypothetical protein
VFSIFHFHHLQGKVNLTNNFRYNSHHLQHLGKVK